MSDDIKISALREELRFRANRLMDRYGTPCAPENGRGYVILVIDGITMHRDKYGMSISDSVLQVYSEISGEYCTNFHVRRAEELVAKMRRRWILDDLADRG